MKDYDVVEKGFEDRRAFEKLDLEEEQKEAVRKAENEFLEGANSQAEYVARREAQKFLIAKPELNLDDLNFADYCKARDRMEQNLEPQLEMGKMNYADYLRLKEQDL
jgi:hypothetical protein